MQKNRLRNITEDIKRWAIDNTAPSGLHSLIQRLHEEIESMDEDSNNSDFENSDDTGGSGPGPNKGRG